MSRRLRVVLVLSCLALGAGAARSAAPLDALLKRRADAFVAAMNAPGDEALKAFARDHLASSLADEAHAARFAEMRRSDFGELGPIEAYRAQIISDGAVLFVYCKRAKTGSWQNYQFRVLADDDHRLQLIFIAIAVEPSEPPATPIDTDESRRWLAKRLKTLDGQQPFAGVISVVRKGREVYSLVEGLADAPGKVRITRESRFGMASGSKMFTAVAILQLDQAGKLKLSDPLIKHLPDFPNKEFARSATLHQLLTHTAGAGDYWDEAYEKKWNSITKIEEMLPFVLSHLGERPAGSFAYSNSGYVLLGLVVEFVSGESYYDYVQEHIFAPAGMKATGYPVRGADKERIAIPYEPVMEAGAVKPGSYVEAQLNARGTSAGGASTTAADLISFASALRGGKLLDKAHLDLMTTRHVSQGWAGSWYGYGLIIEEANGVTSYGHGGNAPGTQFEFKIYPELDNVMIVMSNYNTIAPHEMATAIDRIIRNEAPPQSQ